MGNNLEIIRVLAATARKIYTDFSVKPLTSGHINRTYLVANNAEQLLFQKLNTEVFKNLEGITKNILCLSDYLKEKKYPHQTLQLVPFKNESYLYQGHWRIFEFIKDTQTFLKVQSKEQAYEAAKFLGSFHAHISDIPLEEIQDSIPDFLDFEKRQQQYQVALKIATESRLKKAEDAIEFLKGNQIILEDWLRLLPQIPTRIIHADPKISNFLFDINDSNRILALIDWDTLQHGSILYDFGDMVRSYTNLKDEDDPGQGDNFSLENYRALEEGFLFYLKDNLTSKELENLELGAKLVIYIQAMRFLTDYLNGDIYYTTQYSEQNLYRTKSQIHLLEDLRRKLGDTP